MILSVEVFWVSVEQYTQILTEVKAVCSKEMALTKNKLIQYSCYQKNEKMIIIHDIYLYKIRNIFNCAKGSKLTIISVIWSYKVIINGYIYSWKS